MKKTLLLGLLGAMCLGRLTWLTYLLVTGNVKRLSKTNSFTRVLRYTLYVLPLLTPFLWGFIVPVKMNIIVFTAAILIGVCVFIFRTFYGKSKVYLSNHMLSTYTKHDKTEYIAQTILLIAASIFEEIFYRGYILTIENVNIITLLILSSGLFIAHHLCLKWNQHYKTKDYIRQAFIGFISGLLFITSGSIIPSIILHLLCNSFHIVLYIKMYNYHYGKNVAITQETLDDDDFFS